jgi:hypothetical protein
LRLSAGTDSDFARLVDVLKLHGSYCLSMAVESIWGRAMHQTELNIRIQSVGFVPDSAAELRSLTPLVLLD